MVKPPDCTYYEFCYTEGFEKSRKDLLSDTDLRPLELVLLENPEVGATMGGTGGVRKIRMAREGGGKSGGVRVVYLYVPTKCRIYLLLAFPKNVQANLTDAQKNAVRARVERLKQED